MYFTLLRLRLHSDKKSRSHQPATISGAGEGVRCIRKGVLKAFKGGVGGENVCFRECFDVKIP